MICTSIQNRTYEEILDILNSPEIELAEIRLDRCSLSIAEIKSLFGDSDTPLIATCRISEVGAREAERRLKAAVSSGARFADLEIEAPPQMSKTFQKFCQDNGTELIRSYHNFDETPSDEVLQMALARCFRYGAEIAKIVCTCKNAEDASRLEALYSIVLEDVPSLQGKLIAFGMGEEGKESRIECLRRGAPFTYCALCDEEATAPGQWTAKEMHSLLYPDDAHTYFNCEVQLPASKSFAQRAIIAAALAEGTSHLSAYSPCSDTLSAIEVARKVGATVDVNGSDLTITGIGAKEGCLKLEEINTGESGLLTRLMIPLMSVLNSKDFTIDGRGTLLRRPLDSAVDIMASFGVLLSGTQSDKKELYIPLQAKGRLISGTADIPGSGGSQLISGLLMALPLCADNSELYVHEPKSIPYMYITLDVLKHFGIQTRSEMEGDAELLENEDWSSCTAISFKTRGGQSYKATDLAIESDWSAAASFLAAGAIFGYTEIKGLDTKSLQADLTIIDILVEAGAVVSELEDGTICVRKAPLDGFEQDLNNAPDLFPIVAILAAFCAGESHISGVGRLASKESDRGDAILKMLLQMGVDARIEGDELIIEGESLSGRILSGRLLNGGEYTSRHDHRLVMALKLASLGTKSPIVIDDEACVEKSFPDFLQSFGI